MVDRRGGGGSEDWSEEEWPAGDWERDEPRSRPAAPRPPDRPRPRAAHPVEEEIDADLSRVMDDPMFDALPGGVPITGRGRPGARGPSRLSARRERSGLSAGQTILLLFAIALVAGVSFAAGLVVGASGDKTLLSWIPGFRGAGTETVSADKGVDSELPADAPAEGVISFSEHGRVPPRTEEGADLQEEKAAPRRAAKPEGNGDTEASPEKAAKAEAPAPEAAPATTRDAAPREAARAAAAAPSQDSSDQMTFYDTATGKREAPGLAGGGTGAGDSEAPAEAEGTGAEAASEPSGAQAAAEAPLGADVLARRRAEQSQPPPPGPAEAAQEAPRETRGEAAADRPDTGTTLSQGAPSGAEILARHRAMAGEPGTSGAPAAAPQAAPGAAAGTYTVQVATLTSSDEARGLAERLAAKGFRARIDTLAGAGGSLLYRVRVGRYTDERTAQRDLDRIRQEPGTTPFIKME